MSAEEDTELKNLVAQTLENKGILPKIRAELRANVFLALEENPGTKETLLKNDELSSFVKIPIGSLILNLIREFLEFFELEFTLSVFDPETKYGKEYSNIAKDKMMKALKLPECDQRNPLLYEVIERVINSSDLAMSGSENNFEDLGQGDVSGSCDSAQLIQSPLVLNSTYIKTKSEAESLPPSPIEKEGGKDDENETIKEELLISNNISPHKTHRDHMQPSVSESLCIPDVDDLIKKVYMNDSDSVIGPELNLEKSPRFENLGQNAVSNSSPKDSKPNSPKPMSKTEDIDLLIFTPVKETKSTENSQSSLLSIDKKGRINEKKENVKSMSVLGDLPPLIGKAEEKGDKMTKIKAIMDKWPGLEIDEQSSTDSKSNDDQENDEKSPKLIKSNRSQQSQNSERTETGDDFEEDISDLLNGHTPSDGQLTVDETISKVSCEADYSESV